MEAFFVAIALEMGTKPGVVQTSANTEEAWDRIMHMSAVIKHMKQHPGAPPVFTQLRRMYVELAGSLRHGTLQDESWFWSKLAEIYFEWIARQ